MRYGLFSDVHSNLEAFVAVLGALEDEKVDQYILLGDIGGYGAELVQPFIQFLIDRRVGLSEGVRLGHVGAPGQD